MIITKPRQLRIDLDPEMGYAVGFALESTQSVEEGGVHVADLGPHIEAVAPDAPLVAAALSDLNAANAVALLAYQAEVQRLAGLLAAKDTALIEALAQVQALQAQLAAATLVP